ncbi:hypothetical protein [Winogradskyella sp. UBA3174]|uniref:hypothetical protein n=1 Tax=Winogradskyella sp. UBA3174 TaxID=1947785 RepID=UPI0025EA31F9|nr:hypothetical protein [Winogradskyella sp. UBA3174]|tara:strand:- start:11696 stop:11926 length:231 start_codon:yes stop_codon:yes gene_type:complete
MKKHYSILLFILFISLDAFAHTETIGINNTVVKSGIGLGSVLAVVTSWDRNKSILLAIIHGVFSWLYVIYFALTQK